jgi:hypothetical protein
MDTIQILDSLREELACLKADYSRNPTVKKYNEVCFMERKLAQYTARAEKRMVLSMGVGGVTLE